MARRSPRPSSSATPPASPSTCCPPARPVRTGRTACFSEARSTSAARSGGRELPRQEVDDPPVGVVSVLLLREAVAFVRIDHVLDPSAEATELRDHLIRLPLRHARVVAALKDEHRAPDVRDVRDRRPFDEALAVLR